MKRWLVVFVLLTACSGGSSETASSTTSPTTTATSAATPMACSEFFGSSRSAEEWQTGCTISSAVQIATEFKCSQYSHSTDSAPATDLFQNGHGYGFAGQTATAVTGQLTDDPGYQAAYAICTR